MKVRIVLCAETEGGYSVEVPALPGCCTQGDTLREAISNAREAIEGYLEAAEKLRGKPASRTRNRAVRVLKITV
jgi:predicted RNase H-like HicB family nuclease